MLGVQTHVLRFWETKFSQLRPVKSSGGRRYYRPEDIVLLRRIQELLHSKGYKIKGAQQVLRAAKSNGKARNANGNGNDLVATGNGDGNSNGAVATDNIIRARAYIVEAQARLLRLKAAQAVV